MAYTYSTDELVVIIKAKGITHVAVDFDMTLILTHTGGEEFDPKQILKYHRPYIVELIKKLLNLDIKVAITTFSYAESNIRQLLELLEIYGIPIKGEQTFRQEGKNQHIRSVFPDISYSNILLIDDDLNNLKKANSIGIHTMQCKIQDIVMYP